MANTKLKPCPCGITPTDLCIVDAGQGGKWAYVYGNCCQYWEIEFRTEYNDLESDKCMELAIYSWNIATRGQG